MFEYETIAENHLYKHGFFDYLIYYLKIDSIPDSSTVMYELDKGENLIEYSRLDIKQIIYN